MSREDVLCCILHTIKQKDRVDNISNTWGQHIPYIFYADYADADHKVVKISDKTDYTSGEEKQVNIINYLTSNTEYSCYNWYFFCDNDTFINHINFYQLVNKIIDTNIVYGLVATSWPIDPDLRYCGGGAGFLVHKTILQKLSSKIKLCNTGYSDVTMGLCMRDLKIPICHIYGLNSFSPDKYNLSNINDEITFHYIKDNKLMSELYENTKSIT